MGAEFITEALKLRVARAPDTGLTGSRLPLVTVRPSSRGLGRVVVMAEPWLVARPQMEHFLGGPELG